MLEFLASVIIIQLRKIFTELTREYPQVSVATVYNNLNLFIKRVLLKELIWR